MGRWARPRCPREQIVLFAPTLEDSIPADHPVRLFDEVLRMLDFAEWERHYVQLEGQPPIHPRIMAGVILYGLSLGIRSSRRLEDATGNRIDFIWLASGRVIDHSTLAGFRTRFERELKELFRQSGKVAIGMGLANLNQVSLDGTSKRSNNSRYATARRSGLEQKLAALDEQVEAMLREARQTDEQEDERYGLEGSPSKLPRGLRDLQARRQRLGEAMKKIEAREQKQGKDKSHKSDQSDKSEGKQSKGPAVPTTDPDSSVIQNKSGGFAPNYTLVLATEGQNGFIVEADVAEGNDEPGCVMPVIENLRQGFGRTPGELLGDSNFNTGPNLQQLTGQGIEPWMPPRQQVCKDEENPALREDPTEPVPAERHEKLPLSPQQKVLDKSAFMYDGQRDCYRCPMGKTLSFAGTNGYARDRGVKGTYRIYQSSAGDCGGCPLAGKCLRNGSTTRRVVRDEYEPLREEMAARMRSEAGKGKYRRRAFLSETPFAVIGTTMNVRQMLLRGKQKVAMEWSWISSAYNLRKLAGLLSRSRLPQPATG